MDKPSGENAPRDRAASQRDESEMIREAKALLPQAWTQIYSMHYQTIFRYVRARVYDEATAEDLTSTVFVNALRGIASYQYRGRPFLAWLYRIARNVVISHQRQVLGSKGNRLPASLGFLGRRAQPANGSEPFSSSLDLLADNSPGGDPAAQAERLDLQGALAKLPDSQRDVLTLRYFVGLSSQEIAGLMGKRPGAIYSLQARALVALREQLS